MRYEKESLYLWASPFPSLSECCRWQWSGWCSSLSRRPRPSSSEKWPWIGWRICLSTRRARRASILSNLDPNFPQGTWQIVFKHEPVLLSLLSKFSVSSFCPFRRNTTIPRCLLAGISNLSSSLIRSSKCLAKATFCCGIIRTFRHYWTFHHSTDWICLTFRICCCNPFTP